jgi:hypothetical protein
LKPSGFAGSDSEELRLKKPSGFAESSSE